MDFLLWLVLGILIGAGVAWFWLERKLAEREAEIEANYAGRLEHLQGEVKRADQAHEETKAKLLHMLAERNAAEARATRADNGTAAARQESENALAARQQAERDLE